MADPILIIEGDEQSRIDPTLPDGGLPPVVGVQSFQVFRASRDVPELTDGRGWTYHHHVDMACWRGRLYVGWNACQKDEDVWPSRELYSTSLDGRSWSAPEELFPQGVSTPLRMYFYVARNARMLAIAGLRTDIADTDEDHKGPLVVREIRADHTLGDVFTLQAPASLKECPAMFHASPDPHFLQACQQLLADTVFLEQQDRGKLLGPRRMKWHDPSAWPAGAVPGDSEKWVAGKAYSFFRRPDGLLVGVSKMGWTTASADDGQTWSQPAVPPTLVTGKAKVWAQRLSDGRYALVYNPSRKNRFPLAIVTGDDGVHFAGMRIVQGELPVQRYEGRFRSIGPQYARGISTWADDGSRASEGALWLVYSMSKEDIWVSRVPLPVRTDEAQADGSAWNLYSPKWAPATVEGDTLRLEDRDPYDHAAATRVCRPARDIAIRFEVLAEQAGHPLHVRCVTDDEPVSLAVTPEVPGKWHRHAVPLPPLRSLTFQTAEPRGIGGSHPAPPGTDRPHAPIAFQVRNLTVAGA